MRVILLAGICLLSQPFANAQMCPCEFGGKKDSNIFRFEIGINTYSIQESMFNFNNRKPEYASSFPAGFVLKYHFNKFSLRAGADFIRNDYHFQVESSKDLNQNEGKSTHHIYRVGIEKYFNPGKLQLYAGADLIFSDGKYAGVTKGFGDAISYYSLNYSFNYTSGGISPCMGIKYRPLKSLSFSIETSVSFLYFKTTDSFGPYKEEENFTLLNNPLRSLTVNYHF